MLITVEKSLPVRAAPLTERTLAIAALFGLGLSEAQTLAVLPPTTLSLEPGQIVLITGPSGSGKSTLLAALVERLAAAHTPMHTITPFSASCADASTAVPPMPAAPSPSPAADRALVDALGRTLAEAAAALAHAGLSDAFLLLRRPQELSDGQRFRFRLAEFYASDTPVLVADEFCATLDRITARILAHNLRRFVTASRKTACPRRALLATTHEDLRDDLQPDVHVYKGLGEACVVSRLSSIVDR